MEALFYLLVILMVIVGTLSLIGFLLTWGLWSAIYGIMWGFLFGPILVFCYLAELPNTWVKGTWVGLSFGGALIRIIFDDGFVWANHTVYIMNKKLPPSQRNDQDDA